MPIAMTWEAETEAMEFTAEQERELRALATTVAHDSLRELEAATTEDARFDALPEAVIGAFRLGQHERSRELALEALALAAAREGHWNYGNALHFAHTALGLIALEAGDIPRAVDELARSGAIPGSPQLDSFGPTMQLAKALLASGQSPAVLAYLHVCRAFWTMGTNWLDVWEQKIRSGGTPICFLHAYR